MPPGSPKFFPHPQSYVPFTSVAIYTKIWQALLCALASSCDTFYPVEMLLHLICTLSRRHHTIATRCPPTWSSDDPPGSREGAHCGEQVPRLSAFFACGVFIGLANGGLLCAGFQESFPTTCCTNFGSDQNVFNLKCPRCGVIELALQISDSKQNNDSTLFQSTQRPRKRENAAQVCRRSIKTTDATEIFHHSTCYCLHNPASWRA